MFLSTPDDEESLNFLVDELGMPIIKIGSGNLVNKPFLKAVSGKNKPVILSTGMADREEVFEAYHQLDIKNIYILHCTTCYPTNYHEVNLLAMIELQEQFNEEWYFNKGFGLSDHTPGIEIPIAAVAMGATVIEKHLTLDRNLPGPDHKASLEPDEFKQMVIAIRNVEQAMGDGIKRPCKRELEVRDLIRFKGV